MYSLIRKVFFLLPPEFAHNLTFKLLRLFNKLGLLSLLIKPSVKIKTIEVMGLHFPNRVGLAAGLDKNGECVSAMAKLGFGFIEVGTVTPRPQPGNPKPRLFRLPQAEALINRLGFNNQGVDYLIEQIKKANYEGILGINIGKNFDTPIDKALDDYLIGLKKVYPYASYITVNISSPNTQNLRELQKDVYLENLLSTLKQEQKLLTEQYKKYAPLVLKIAPDLTALEIKYIAESLLKYAWDGVIATNTTLMRDAVQNLKHGAENGGLSGKPLFNTATEVVKLLHQYMGDQIPIIAAGGILSAADAQAKLAAGAKLVQLYTGLIYRGPQLIKQIID